MTSLAACARALIARQLGGAVDVPSLGDLDLDVSVLSALEPFAFASEAEALAALRPGVDGVVFAWHHTRVTFLPVMYVVPEVHDPAPSRAPGEVT